MEESERLWEVDDQRGRLDELTARAGASKESPLRRDVRSLGRLLGGVLKEQAGEALFDTVEELRSLTSARRESSDKAERQKLMSSAESVVGRASIEEAYRLSKAFAIYFELTNLAETNHRKRRRRAAEVSGAEPQAGTFPGTLRRVREAAERITAEITALWQTDEVRRRQPTVRDEIKMGLDYYPASLVKTVPEVYEEMADAFRATYGRELEARELPRVVRFGSWIGGDRDGNPFVTPGCTRDALRMARETVLDFYLAAVDELHERLSGSSKQSAASRALVAALEECERMLPPAARRPF